MHLVDFPQSFTRGATFVTSSLLSCTPNPFCRGTYSKRKEFAPTGSKFFPFRVDPFSEGMQKQFDRVASHEDVSILLFTIELRCIAFNPVDLELISILLNCFSLVMLVVQ